MRGTLPALALAALGCTGNPLVEQTVDRQKDQLALHVFTSMATIQKAGDHRVHFTANQAFTSKAAAANDSRDFILATGESFVQQDHHSKVDYKVVAVRPSSVVLEYNSAFSHLSFGKNLVTKDKGSFEVSYK